MNPVEEALEPTDLFRSLFGLEGQVTVVTGAGTGLGRELAMMLALAGATIAVADIDFEAARRVASDIVGRGARAEAFKVDVANEASVEALFSAIREKLGPIQILVNNAGVYPNKPLLEMTAQDWDSVHHVNLRGPFLCSREAIKQMKEGGKGGRIVNISSINSLHPTLMGNAHYGASKAGLNMLTKSTALEFAADGINANVLVPGGILTENRKKRVASAGAWIGPASDPSRFLLGAAPPWKHAAAVLFLVGPGAAHVTGQTLVTDGGFLIS
jgi:NAD(P)-dependent dehydrogenase (short-subunit alcohol dehydrogenase family)